MGASLPGQASAQLLQFTRQGAAGPSRTQSCPAPSEALQGLPCPGQQVQTPQLAPSSSASVAFPPLVPPPHQHVLLPEPSQAAPFAWCPSTSPVPQAPWKCHCTGTLLAPRWGRCLLCSQDPAMPLVPCHHQPPHWTGSLLCVPGVSNVLQGRRWEEPDGPSATPAVSRPPRPCYRRP